MLPSSMTGVPAWLAQYEPSGHGSLEIGSRVVGSQGCGIASGVVLAAETGVLLLYLAAAICAGEHA